MAIQSSYFVPQGGSVEPPAFANEVGDLVLNQEPPTTNAWATLLFEAGSGIYVQDNTYVSILVPEAYANSKAVLLYLEGFTHEGGSSLYFAFRPTAGILPILVSIFPATVSNTSLIMPIVNGAFEIAFQDVSEGPSRNCYIFGGFGG